MKCLLLTIPSINLVLSQLNTDYNTYYISDDNPNFENQEIPLYVDEYYDQPPESLTGEEAFGVLTAIKIAAEQELNEIQYEQESNDATFEQNSLSKWEIAVSELSKIMGAPVDEIKVNMTASLGTRIASNSIRSGNCNRKARKKSSKKNNNNNNLNDQTCEAILPLDLNYGCWCHADSNDVFKGKGQHVDEFDFACKMYKQCMRCVKHDARKEGEVCDPGTQAFITTNQRDNTNSGNIHTECSSSNQSNCAINTCCCEVEYVRTILELFIVKGVSLKNKYSHKKFDYNKNCSGNGKGGNPECCGQYPKRKMYSADALECCLQMAVYNPFTQVCCDDGYPAAYPEECVLPLDDSGKRVKNNRRKRRR